VHGAAWGDSGTNARDLLRQICQGRDVELCRGGGLSGPHPHVGRCASTIGLGQAYAVHERALKRMPLNEFTQLKSITGVNILRHEGIFCASVGAVDENTIRRHIENQQWDDLGENFKITAPTRP
jgi:putative transposase